LSLDDDAARRTVRVRLQLLNLGHEFHNFEQIIAHAAESVSRWLERAGEASFLVTSRERLGLKGEEVFDFEPLPVEGDGVRLFELRAEWQRPGYMLGEESRKDVMELVRLLDGLPLAIELAAARVRILSPAQLIGRLRDRFKVLQGATRSSK